MPSAYTPLLRLTLPADGELVGTWGQTVNKGITELIEASIAGTAVVPMADADQTLSTINGGIDSARNAVIQLTGALTAQRSVICPSTSKTYLVRNSTTGGFGVNFKTAAGAGVVVAPGGLTLVYCDGTDVMATAASVSGDMGVGGDMNVGGDVNVGGILNVGGGPENETNAILASGVTDGQFQLRARQGVAGSGNHVLYDLMSTYGGAGSLAGIKFYQGVGVDGALGLWTSNAERLFISKEGNVSSAGPIGAPYIALGGSYPQVSMDVDPAVEVGIRMHHIGLALWNIGMVASSPALSFRDFGGNVALMLHNGRAYGANMASVANIQAANYAPFDVSGPTLVPVNSAYNFVPFVHGITTIDGIGYAQHVTFGAFRYGNPSGGWEYGGGFIGVGGNDNFPTEYFKFEYGSYFGHSSGALRLRGPIITADVAGQNFTVNAGNDTGPTTGFRVTGDISVRRGSALNTGVVYFGDGNPYLFYNGTGFTLAGGSLTVSNGDVIAASDARLKRNVRNINEALARVLALRGVTFTRIDAPDPAQRRMGLIAQEVEGVVPEVVMTDMQADVQGRPSAGLKSVAYGNLVGLLIEAIRELNTKVELLGAR